MKDCLKEQKEVEQHILLAEILLSEKTINEYQKDLADFEGGLQATIDQRHKHLK